MLREASQWHILPSGPSLELLLWPPFIWWLERRPLTPVCPFWDIRPHILANPVSLEGLGARCTTTLPYSSPGPERETPPATPIALRLMDISFHPLAQPLAMLPFDILACVPTARRWCQGAVCPALGFSPAHRPLHHL